MATNKDITMRQFNGTDYDTLYPKTTVGQVDGAVSYDTVQSLTTAQQTQARENMNAAPGGYGFEANAKYLTASDNIDALVVSGIYQWRSNNAPQGTLPTTLLSYAYNLFVRNSGATCVQTAVDTSDSNYHGCAIQRTIYGSRVFPWEWVNPPMDVGVEYRTTERYLGKPIYKKIQSDNIEYWSIDEGVTWKPKSYYVRDYQFSTTDLTAGSSALPDGTVYYVYE